jgi:hypothetical protein
MPLHCPSWTAWPLKTGPIGSPETQISNPTLNLNTKMHSYTDWGAQWTALKGKGSSCQAHSPVLTYTHPTNPSWGMRITINQPVLRRRQLTSATSEVRGLRRAAVSLGKQLPTFQNIAVFPKSQELHTKLQSGTRQKYWILRHDVIADDCRLSHSLKVKASRVSKDLD